jgi:N4-gp56 family major capsid protein
MPSVLNTAVQAGAGFSVNAEATRDVFSAEIWFAAMPVLKFDQFSTRKTELGVQPGRTIVIPKFGSIKRGGRIAEGKRIETKSMSSSTSSISVAENANAIGFSEFLLQTSFYDQMAAASLILGRDMALVLDLQLRDTARLATARVYAGGQTSRGALLATNVFDTRCIKDAVEILETANAPKWMGDHYVCFAHPHQMRGLRDDNDWINASLYAGATSIYTGEVGRYEDCRFISTTVMPNGANNGVDAQTGDYIDIGFDPNLRNAGAGGTVNVYQAIMFGEYAIGHATALPVELRDNGVEDFGREHGLAWYAIWGQGVLENGNVVIIETA